MPNIAAVLRPAAFFLTALALTGCIMGKPVTIVEEGRPAATIVLRDNAGDHVTEAVRMLQKYVRQMSGVELAIALDTDGVDGPRILIGPSKATEAIEGDLRADQLGYDGCIVRTSGDDLVILGPNDRGVANGVRWLLQWKLGVHWLGPRSDALVVPRRKTIRVKPFCYAHKPSFAWRNSWISSRQQAYTADEIENLDAMSRFNFQGGINLSGGHALENLVHPSAHYGEHPEYFSLIDGRRVAKSQPCLSNPDVFRTVVEQMKQVRTDMPVYVSLSPNDRADWCECEPCRQMAEDPAARMLIFSNRVVEAVEATHPRLGVCFLAFSTSDTIKPPLGLKAHRRVVPMIAPLDYPSIHRLTTSLDPAAVRTRGHYEGWTKVAENIVTYPFMYAFIEGVLPTPVPAVTVDEVRHFHKLGFIGVQREHIGRHGARGFMWEMSYWLEWQLMWDAEQDVEHLRGVFLRGYYGAAHEPMRRLYRRVEAAVTGPPRAAGGKKPAMAALAKTVDANERDLAEAQRLADTPAAAAHVELDRRLLGLMHAVFRVEAAFDRWKRDRSEANRNAARRQLDQSRKVLRDAAELSPFVRGDGDKYAFTSDLLDGNVAWQWMLIGPFDNTNGAGFDKPYPPERAIDLSKRYDGKGGVTVAWRRAETPTTARLDIKNLFDDNQQSVCYALCYVHAAEASPAQLMLGSDDGVKVWLNDRPVHRNFVRRRASPDQDKIDIQLEEGWNRILVKIDNQRGGWALYLRITGAIPPLRFAATPEK